MKLSEHFTLAEAERSQLALRKGIDNTAPRELIYRLQMVAEKLLEPPRQHFGIPFTPNSWYRCLELNRALGSKDTSQHVKCEAVDFEIPGIANIELGVWMIENTEFDQIIFEFVELDDPTSGWIHASINAEGNNRGQVLTINSEGTKYGAP